MMFSLCQFENDPDLDCGDDANDQERYGYFVSIHDLLLFDMK
jgi:hypothetical protein